MFRHFKSLMTAHRARAAARRRELLSAFAAQVIRDCYDPRRQAERLARWDALLNQ